MENNIKVKENITIIKNEITDLLESIDNLEVNIIQLNNKNTKTIEFYKLMMENLILEHHDLCKKIFN
jgi:hypothetical protein